MRGLGQVAELAAIARPDVGVITGIGPVHLELVANRRVGCAGQGRAADRPARGRTGSHPGGRDAAGSLPQRRPRDDHVRRGRRRSPRRVSTRRSRGRARRRRPWPARLRSLQFHLPPQRTKRARGDRRLRRAGPPARPRGRGRTGCRLSRCARREEHELEGDVLLLNDCYNANPVSMQAAIEHLRERGAGRRLVAVLGGMAELGAEASAFHCEVAEAAARAGVEVLVAVGPLARGYLACAADIGDVRAVDDVDAAVAELRGRSSPRRLRARQGIARGRARGRRRRAPRLPGRLLVLRPGSRLMILAREKQAGQGHRELRCADMSGRLRTRHGAVLQPPRARVTSGMAH